MGWSTRQLAELSGTTVKAIRHYHEIGLLDEPERASNGYKQYGTAHLVRVLQIARMKELGVPLAQIATMGRADEDPEAAIEVLDADLAATIERLQRIRAELAIVLKYRAPIDTPVPFQPVAQRLSERDRKLVTVLSRVFEPEALEDFTTLLGEDNDNDELFDALTPDAGDDQIHEVARRLAADIARDHQRFPWMKDSLAQSKGSPGLASAALQTAITELYNTAQVKALVAAFELTQTGSHTTEPTTTDADTDLETEEDER
ncbi:transcriptional regulator, MerR family protein [Tsukamurella pulmonis]|uniref:helix-turn-helix domain-containing protein n=1 Tax=Tsukamurella pulmonis TaxID=47312 RepID=UPI001EDDCAEE|nr:MerR family transcriptional regulator [Tsukamurella pulmonis]BDD82294.1 transcriptional regulator, MerR family protein [Tsukamurella pulmonis]